MDKPTDTAVAKATLTFAARGSDEVMYFLASHFAGGDVITLLQRLQNISVHYQKCHCLPDISDIIECVMVAYTGEELERLVKKSVTQWAQALEGYARMSLVSLASALTNNYRYWIIDSTSSYWPRQLFDLPLHTQSQPPLCLWGLGDMNALVSCPEPISIVGSRAVDAYGRQVAFQCGKYAAIHGHTVISGGALGADAAAHWGALAAADCIEDAGKTIAVMAGGLNYIGPARNSTLFDRIIQTQGAIISELAPNTTPEPYRFLHRNRLIAALGSVVIISQAQARSGALNTATWAAELNRLVVAAPGNINTVHNTGCNRLIYDGKATLLVSATDLSDVCHASHDPLAASKPATGSVSNPP
ncbi:DNA processing protein DprA [Alloscardovia criceti]|uniref:DNA processing protein DprA n=1 Tax=Alloscardovia criceti TaxID=356828 RepID=UPI00036D01B3|nr:DNA processing protein DprA [Alloscardovia criceti]